MISPELAAWRQKFADDTKADRKREVAGGTRQITQNARATLTYLLHGDRPQQESGAA